MAETAAGPDSSYVIRTGAEARERLELIARVCWPASEAFLARTGAGQVERFLDVGCGIGDVASRMALDGVRVAGIDVNAEVVALAQARARDRGSPAEYFVAGTLDLGTAPFEDYDTVYARCVLSHLADPAAAVASMVAAARPGGSILIEDVEVAAIWCSPPCPALDRHKELYVAAAQGLGAHPNVGPQLAGFLEDAGAVDVEVDVVQPVLRAPEDLKAHARTMEAIAGPVLAQGLATGDEVAALVAELDAWAERPGFVATLPRLVQVNARVPER